MIAYLLMLGVPAVFALTGVSRPRLILLLVVVLYCLMIALRFQVGMDWNNYLRVYGSRHSWPVPKILAGPEPGFGLLIWVADKLGGGMVLVNAVAGLSFCVGFFAVARRCREPLLAVVIATPLLVIPLAMSGTRQAIACGVIFLLFSKWESRSTLQRILFVLFASLFHFSALFVMVFVAVASHSSRLVRFAGTAIICALVLTIISYVPDPIEKYSRLYISGPHAQSAQGAVGQVGLLALAGLVYFALRRRLIEVNGDNLYDYLAAAALAAFPFILVSSVGAYRFALYFWPMGMYVFSGVPALIGSATGRALYRILSVAASFALLIGWLVLANTSFAWLPYRNWLMNRDAPLVRRDVHGTMF
jgi:hypothetical protein